MPQTLVNNNLSKHAVSYLLYILINKIQMADFTVWSRINVPLNEYLQGKFQNDDINPIMFVSVIEKYKNISRYRINKYFRNSFQSFL